MPYIPQESAENPRLLGSDCTQIREFSWSWSGVLNGPIPPRPRVYKAPSSFACGLFKYVKSPDILPASYSSMPLSKTARSSSVNHRGRNFRRITTSAPITEGKKRAVGLKDLRTHNTARQPAWMPTNFSTLRRPKMATALLDGSFSTSYITIIIRFKNSFPVITWPSHEKHGIW